MDHQLDESLNLDDGGIGIDFDGEQEVVTTSDCSFDTSTVQMENDIDEDMEVGQIKDEHHMETDCDIIGEVQYIQKEESIDQEVTAKTTIEIPSSFVSTSSQSIVIDNSKINTPIAVAPKLSRTANTSSVLQSAYSLQTFRIGASSLKPVSIAPKPATMSSNFTNVKKISLSSVQPRSSGILTGGEVGGRQVVVVPSGAGRLKMVGTPAPLPIPLQLQVRQRTTPPLSKLTLAPGIDTSGGVVTVQKRAPARYISIQQAQQMGLLTGGKITQLVTMSPNKQPVATSTPLVRPIRQSFNTIKSPTKILPAPQGVTSGNKVVLTPQSIVVRPTTSKPAQVLKMEGGTTGTILASLPAGQKINPQQIHQINIPGKGVQYVRLVPASGLGGQVRASGSSNVAPTTTLPVVTPISPNKSIRLSTPQILPKTFLITDFQSNLMQVVPNTNKGQSINNTNTATTKKFVNKQTKLVPISVNMATATVPKTTELAATTTPVTFTVASTKMETVNPEIVPKVESIESVSEPSICEQEIIEESSKVIDQESQQEDDIMNDEEIIQEVSLDNEVHEIEDMIKGESESPSKSPDVFNLSNQAKHIVMVPASYLQQIQQPNQQNNKVIKTQPNIEIKEEMPEYNSKIESVIEFGLRPRKPCNCTKSQCLKLYCDCFANGEFCNQCNCNNCFNNLENEEYRQKAIRSCLERNPNAFRPKIGKAKNNLGPDIIRRHNKGCNCKRSGCLKNYCECYEGKIACSANCKCVGCRNIEDSMDKKLLRRTRAESVIGIGAETLSDSIMSHNGILNMGNNQNLLKTHNSSTPNKQPCSIMTNDVIEAVCQCLIAQAADAESVNLNKGPNGGAARQVLEEFAHCLKDIISAAQHTKSSSQHKNISIV